MKNEDEQTIKCMVCHKTIDKNALICPGCKRINFKSVYFWLIIAGLILVFFTVFCFVMSGNQSESNDLVNDTSNTEVEDDSSLEDEDNDGDDEFLDKDTFEYVTKEYKNVTSCLLRLVSSPTVESKDESIIISDGAYYVSEDFFDDGITEYTMYYDLYYNSLNDSEYYLESSGLIEFDSHDSAKEYYVLKKENVNDNIELFYTSEMDDPIVMIASFKKIQGTPSSFILEQKKFYCNTEDND